MAERKRKTSLSADADVLDEPPVQEGVPPTRAQRRAVARAVDRILEGRSIRPPIALDRLTALADEVLAEFGTNGAWRKYVTVLVNNALWRPLLAEVPYRRRLLLLPQCLRDPLQCRGKIDEYGLLCAGCGRCPIHEFQAEAERLGYAVLVAEGSTIVTSMIAAGKIDAIVGASCLSVLERVFPYMESGVIAGAAIPLLRDGCTATAVDADAVWDALYLSTAEPSGRMELEVLRDEVDEWFTPDGLAATLGAPTGRCEQIAQEWLVRGGKRWRPFLTACAFQALQPDPTARLPEDLRRIGLAVECFHKASLVHDDIEDDDDRRYGQAALHVEHGVPVALNVGDLLLGEGYRMIGECAAPPEAKAAMLAVAAAGHRRLALGQGAELCWRREPEPMTVEGVIEIFRLKTSPAFEVALRLGAIYGRGGPQVHRALTAYSDALGIAYQIRDDLADFRGDGEDRGDAAARRPSLLLSLAFQRAEGAARAALENMWRTGRRSRRHEHAAELIAAEVESEAAAMLERYKARASAAVSDLPNPTLRELLRRVIVKIFNPLECPGWCREHQAGNAPGLKAGGGPAA